MTNMRVLGPTISHYDIVEKIGEGGMGAVYKARDTSLDRPVALKILPPERVTDPERRARFAQEARAASSLNHPNIVTIYEIGAQDDVHFIAMEYVEGETLDHVMGRRGLPLRQAVDYAIQIADGMGKAHAAGIIHRDLKPSNILVTTEGRVKILDFGLAKLVERPAAVEEGATRTTFQPHLTEQGQIVGTIAYMSPEQVGGGRLDTRSDIFSFGIVLYEMLAGRRPFEGESNASTLQAILSKDPPPPSDVVGALPFELERATLRCLRKEPERRWQTMGDLKVALEDLRDDLRSGKVSQVGVAAIAPPHRRRWVLAAAVAAPVLVLAALAGTWWMLRPAAQAPALEAERVTFEGSAVIPPAISSDGKLIVYAALRDGWYNLFVQQLGGGVRQAARLTQHESNDSFPSFSPDGLSVVYRSERDGGGLFVVDTLGAAGRAERKLTDGGHYPSVSPDGASVAYIVPEAQAARGRVEVVPIGGGTPRRIGPDLVAIKVGNTYVPPLWSTDSASVLFRAIRGREAATRGWWVASISGTDAAPLEGMPPDPRWQARGAVAWWQDAIYYVEGEPTGGATLFRVRVRPGPWRTAGPPEKIASPAGFAIGNSVSKDGRAVFTSISATTNIWSAALSPDKLTSGPLQRVTSDSMGKRGIAAAEDGSRIAYVSYTYSRLRGVEVRIREMATGRETLIAGSGTFPFMDPLLNADGSMLAYRDRPEQEAVSYLAKVGEPGRRLCSDCEVMGFFRDTPDALIWTQNSLMRQPLAGAPTSLVIEEQPEPYITALALSPSGKWLALTRAAPPDGSATLWLADLSHGVSKPGEWRLVAEDRNHLTSPAWSPDGTVLYYLSRLDGFNCLWGRGLKPDGTPSGPAVPVLHLHTQHPVWEFSGQRRVAVTNDRIFVFVDDVTGDAWSMKLQP